jgi:hypothetical protein
MAIRVLSLLIALLALPACSDNESFAYRFQYMIVGRGEGVTVEYLRQPGSVLAEQKVDLPWTSEEFQEERDTTVLIRAQGATGTRLRRCAVRYRPADGRYGGNGSGTKAQTSDDPTTCGLRSPLK